MITQLPNSILPHQKKSRLYYFLIWGHGLRYKKEMLAILQEHTGLEIIYIANHAIKNIKTFVNQVYAHDYAPFHHLKEKTRYLLKTPSNIQLIVVKNNKPAIDFFGTNSFRHEECLAIKTLKEQIRNSYNPRTNGKRSEHHVIHACDNPNQLHQLLLDLNYPNGYFYFDNHPNPCVSTPFYIKETHSITLKKIELSTLYASILHGNSNHISHKLTPLNQTPHYKTVSQKTACYQNYLDRYFGNYLKSNYSVKNFLALSTQMHYLENNYSNHYILVKALPNNKYQILDGLHRATILKFNKKKDAIIGIANAY